MPAYARDARALCQGNDVDWDDFMGWVMDGHIKVKSIDGRLRIPLLEMGVFYALAEGIPPDKARAEFKDIHDWYERREIEAEVQMDTRRKHVQEPSRIHLAPGWFGDEATDDGI